MKIALAQMEVVPGCPRKNLETMLGMIEEAKAQQADLIAFPELCLGGYLLGDRFTEEDYCANLMEFNEELRKASGDGSESNGKNGNECKGIAIAYGNVFLERDINARVGDNNTHPNKDGRLRKYNAVHLFQNGKEIPRLRETKALPPGVQPKTLLPNYRFFDDERYFFSLEDVAKDFDVPLEELAQPFLIETRDGEKVPIGFEVCEDLWCADYRRDGEAQNITKMLIQNGARYIVNISASPWTAGKNSTRDRRIKFLKQESNDAFVPFLYVNCVGAQNNGKNIVTFDGGTTVYNANGEPIILNGEHYEQDLVIVGNSDFDKPAVQRAEKPKIVQKLEAIIKGIQHVKDMNGWKEQPKYVLGMSGGIDSAIVAAILTLAVGKDKVLGINMPTVYNSAQTKKAAEEIAQKLGIGYEVVSIGELVDVNYALLNTCDLDGSGKKLSSLNEENVQAKIRGTTVLSNIAAKYGALFTNNGNKVEVFFGYATLYGDVNGAIAPIADLTKAEIFELARYLNKEVFHQEVIPETLIPDELFRFREDQIQPSAELKEKQVDPMKFGYHCAMIEKALDYKKTSPEQFMRWYLEGTLHTNLGISEKLMERWGVDEPQEFVSDLENFAQVLQRSTFKRVQSPPIIITSKTSFGYDLRESILPWEPSLEYGRLKEQILGMNQKYQQKESKEPKELGGEK